MERFYEALHLKLSLCHYIFLWSSFFLRSLSLIPLSFYSQSLSANPFAIGAGFHCPFPDFPNCDAAEADRSAFRSQWCILFSPLNWCVFLFCIWWPGRSQVASWSRKEPRIQGGLPFSSIIPRGCPSRKALALRFASGCLWASVVFCHSNLLTSADQL